ncbi:hypothetical protein COCON_G00225570 [Conger conger]|uniref:Uncharacterized protein n=1 Tax=Conger conger TaxID=82655 RepID=A0A9Q1HLF3_CONCO|nr:hypothetical protein COCON_G00225570 [Conger conger]
MLSNPPPLSPNPRVLTFSKPLTHQHVADMGHVRRAPPPHPQAPSNGRDLSLHLFSCNKMYSASKYLPVFFFFSLLLLIHFSRTSFFLPFLISCNLKILNYALFWMCFDIFISLFCPGMVGMVTRTPPSLPTIIHYQSVSDDGRIRCTGQSVDMVSGFDWACSFHSCTAPPFY